MARLSFEDSFEIYLFTDTGPEDNFSKLSEFLSFLKFNRVTPPYKFSYVGQGDGLIPELSLNDNILMDFNPDSLTAARGLQFQEFLKEKTNLDLFKLYQKIAFPHELPTNSEVQMKKIASLIKALIFEGQFIFLEEPEQDLDAESVALFISVMKDHIVRHHKNVFIFSNNSNLWMPHIHKLVKRDKDFSFKTEKITKSWHWEKEREQFFYPPAKNAKEDILNFHIPGKDKGKKSVA